jgi:spore germination protein YaaH
MNPEPHLRLRVFVSIAAMVVAMLGAVGSASISRRVSASLVFWDQDRGIDAIIANADILSEVSPFWYHVGSDGRVNPYKKESGATYEDPSLVSFLRGRRILVIPTVTNIVDGVWDGALISRIIADSTLRSVNINSLVALVESNGYDGIDLDYEDLAASDRAAFSAFVVTLADALHARGKLLTVNVYAKTSEPGTWDGPVAQDWTVVGEVADQVRIMTYEYHWASSGPGPIAPIDWVAQVLSFARSVIPAAKIMQGVPFYGYDWIGQAGTPLVWQEAMALAGQHGAPIGWDANAAAPWFEYVAARRQRHTVWFENGSSVDAKLSLANTHDIGGVSLWRLGGEDPDVWSRLRDRFDGLPMPDTTPPNVTIVSPNQGATVQRKERIEAQVVDDVAVARVEFYVNGGLLTTDLAAPYVVYWNTRRAPSGPNLITVVAYDAVGNRDDAEMTVYR